MHLARAPRALWGINASYFLEGLAYFGVLTILGKYCIDDMGLTEPQANIVYMVLTAGITLSMLFLGGVPDRIGVRRSLLLSLTVMVLGRLLLAASGTFFDYGGGLGSPMFFVVLAGVLVIVVGYGAYQPAAYAGVKQFTNQKTSAIGYAMIYALMNLGAFVSGILSPPVRHATGMVGVFWVYVGITVLAALSVVFLLTRKTAAQAVARVRSEDEGFDRAQGKAPAQEKAPAAGPGRAARSLAEPVTVGLALVSALALFLFLHQLFTAQPSEVERLAQDASAALSEGAEAFSGAAEAERSDEDFLAAVAAAPGALQSVVRRVTAPPASESLEVQSDAYTLLRARLETLTSLFAELEAQGAALRQPQSSLLTEPLRAELARKLRVRAVALMVFAYGMVGPVDGEVVESQRLRLKQPGDETPIPVTPAEAEAIVALAGAGQPAMMDGLAARSSTLAQELQETLPAPLGPALGALFRADAAFATRVARAWGEGLGPVAREMVSDFLVADAMLARSLATLALAPDAPAGAEAPARAPRVADYLADRLAAEAAALGLEETGGVFATAARPPLVQRVGQWALGGGFYLLLGVLALALLGWRVLRLRPDHPFHNTRFTFFIFILIPVQTLFAHNWLTLPLYIDRAFAGTFVGHSFEFFSNINPVLIFVVTPIVAALTARTNVYRMMIWGTLVMAAPTFLLVLPASPALLLLYIFLMSIGEAMWQPRFLQLVAEIAPEGKTGAYMGIAQLPWFLTKLVTAAYAGFFLQAYVPKVGPQNPEFMWFVYGLIAMVSPLALIAARSWVGTRITEKH